MSDHRRRVLVVDDDVRTARLLARMLVEDGFEVEVTADGAHAIARLSRGDGPELLVTDIRMPHVDGLAVARYARAVNPNIAVFFVTGYPEFFSHIDTVLPPVARVFPKPLAYSDLTAAMHGSLATA